MRSRLAVLIALPALAACGSWTDQVAGPANNKLPTQVQSNVSAQDMRDRYIVVFRDDVQNPSALTDALVSQAGGTVHFRYAHALRGFAATIPAAAVAGIRNNPMVSLVEADGIVSTTATQSNATWGLDRIDQRDLPLSTTYTYDQTGAGVTVYIIDTGIRYSHNEFGGRATLGFDALGGTGSDCHGHGTHVAGTVGGAVYGVAKGVTLKAVRVLNCQGSGTNSGVIAGVDWVSANHASRAVANMSLGGGASSSLDNAVNNAVASGVVFAVAAGNSNADACNFSPARAADALTVGSTTSSDARSSFSNFGTCLDIFAPGSGITSAWSTSNTAINTISGTSMASPHVAGVAALYREANPAADPAAVAAAITSQATPNKIALPGTGSPNLLLYNLNTGGGGGGPPPPPPSDITLTASGFKERGVRTANLTWTGANGANVDVYRNNVIFTTTANDGQYTDVSGKGGSITYKVCEAGTSTCSNSVPVTF